MYLIYGPSGPKDLDERHEWDGYQGYYCNEPAEAHSPRWIGVISVRWLRELYQGEDQNHLKRKLMCLLIE